MAHHNFCSVDIHFCLVLIEGKDISCDTLEEEERTLDKDIPQHGGHQDSSEVPEYLKKEKKILISNNIRLIWSLTIFLHQTM